MQGSIQCIEADWVGGEKWKIRSIFIKPCMPNSQIRKHKDLIYKILRFIFSKRHHLGAVNKYSIAHLKMIFWNTLEWLDFCNSEKVEENVWKWPSRTL